MVSWWRGGMEGPHSGLSHIKRSFFLRSNRRDFTSASWLKLPSWNPACSDFLPKKQGKTGVVFCVAYDWRLGFDSYELTRNVDLSKWPVNPVSQRWETKGPCRPHTRIHQLWMNIYKSHQYPFWIYVGGLKSIFRDRWLHCSPNIYIYA